MNGEGSGLQGKVAVITGGGTGIGAATARLFAARKADGVVLAARTPEQLDAVAGEINRGSDSRAVAVPTDVKDEDSIVALVTRTIEEFGRVDILVNNAEGPAWGRSSRCPPGRGTRPSR